jgi:TetR/AcrR family transcriptional regulator, cholesterol catabolism regulator
MTRQEQAQRRREELMDAALAVFATKGVDGSSIKDIAQAASVTPGLLYHYFESKEALAAAVLEERGFLPELRALLDERSDEPANVVLPELIRAFDETLAANLVSLFFSVGPANAAAVGALREFVVTGQSVLEAYLDTRAAAGELKPHLVGVAARTVFASVAIAHKTGQRVNVEDLVDLVLSGLIDDRGVG